MFAAVRVQKISKMSQMKGLSMHAMRLDKNTQKYLRDDAHKGRCLAWSSAEKADNRNVSEAFKQFKKREKANEYQGASLGLHMLCVVSPEWIKEAGGIHERRNPRNAMLMKAAKDWAESIGGKGSVIASRLDLDEKGGGVVDLYFCPTKMVKGKKFILTSSVLRDLRHELDEGREYSALQTSWAAHAKQALDDRFERGVRIEQTGRKYYSPELFREYAEKAVAVEKSGINKQLERSKNMRKRSIERFSDVDKREKDLDAKIAAFSVMKQKAEAEFAADQEKAKLAFADAIQIEENRLKAKERQLDDQSQRLNRQKQTLDERELKVSANERKIENAYQRLNSEQSALSERENRVHVKEETVKVRSVVLDGKERAVIGRENAIENKFSANRVIDFAVEFSTNLNSGVSFEKIIKNVVEGHVDFSKFKTPESQNLAQNFFKMMSKTAAEIDKMRGRGAPVVSRHSKGIERN